MEIVNKREKIIFTEEEAKAMVLVHKIMRDIEDDTDNEEVRDSTICVADYLIDFIEDNFEDTDCVVRQGIADSTREITISIAIK